MEVKLNYNCVSCLQKGELNPKGNHCGTDFGNKREDDSNNGSQATTDANSNANNRTHSAHSADNFKSTTNSEGITYDGIYTTTTISTNVTICINIYI